MSKTAKNDARSAYYKLYREENRESLKAKRRAYYLANRDHILEKDRIYRSRDDIKAMDRQRRFENSERYSLRQKAYRSRPDIKARDKALRENNRERRLELQRIRRSLYLVKEMIRRARTRARKEGVVFNLTEDDIYLPTHCPVLKMELKSNTGVSGPNSYSIDRIKPDAGYVAGNVCVISNRANLIKSNANADELFAVARYVAEQERIIEECFNKGMSHFISTPAKKRV